MLFLRSVLDFLNCLAYFFLNSEHVTNFNMDAHTIFLNSFIKNVPSQYASLESTRMTLLFFVLGGLDIIDQFSESKEKSALFQWIDAQQIKPDPTRRRRGKSNFQSQFFIDTNCYRKILETSIFFTMIY